MENILNPPPTMPWPPGARNVNETPVYLSCLAQAVQCEPSSPVSSAFKYCPSFI